MTVFLIIVAVLAVIIAIILSDLISFILFPEKKAHDAADERKNKKKVKKSKPAEKAEEPAVEPSEAEFTVKADEKKARENKPAQKQPEQKKTNPIKKMWDEEGIVGILSFVSNLLETANSAVLTIFRGLHIYSLYVMILVGGPDADMIARSYGTLCKYYYPVKGLILNGMKVDQYDDYIQPDFIADRTEFEFQFIGSISVGLLLKAVLKAGIVFLKNFINNKKGDKKA